MSDAVSNAVTDLDVRALNGEDWAAYRDIRLAALRDAPDAFASTYEQEAGFAESLWRSRLARSARLLATQNGAAIGIVSVGEAEPDVAELFGMWVVASSRGAGVAWRLTQAASEHASAEGRRALRAWVSTDNGRAVAFFSSYGFRPTDIRRPMTTDADTEEMAMTLPLGEDRGWLPPNGS